MKRFQKALIWLVSGSILCVALGFSVSRFGYPISIKHVGSWSIGVEEGVTPFYLKTPVNIKNPVLTAGDVNDVKASFVADPFMLIVNSTYYMFFEVFNEDSRQGDIGLAISNDGKKWIYQKIVLDEPFHLSYPYVFIHEGNYYMIPESHKDSTIRLYVARKFPEKWEYSGNLLSGSDFVDPSILRHNGKWWIFVSSRTNDILRLYYSDRLTGPWIEHSKSPIIQKDVTKARPGGRIIKVDNKIYRISQNDYPRYGTNVNAFEIIELNIKLYQEIPYDGNPILERGQENWNNLGMHHMDVHKTGENRWFACVDGFGKRWVMSVGSKYFDITEILTWKK
jgi:Glycosyl hydrolases family 43